MKLKKYLKLATVVTSLSLVLTGCSTTKEEVKENEKKEDKTITLVLDRGGINDQSFNESSWKGAEKASKDYGVEVKFLESNTEMDYTTNIENAIDMESDLIIGIGFNLSEAIEKAAKSYPEQQFAIIDGSFETVPSNVTSINFNEKEAGYLAGIASAKTIKEDKFGFVGGYEVPAVVNYMQGFEEGLKSVNPNATLLTQYANSFTDAAKGRVIAQQLIDQGASVVVASAGCVNNGIYEICKEKGKYAVAVDMAQNHIEPKVILTSAIKKVDVGVSDTIKKFIDGKLEGGTTTIYNILNDGVGYEQTDLLSQDTISYVDSIIKDKKENNK